MSPFSPWQQRAFDQTVAALDAGRLGHGLLICGPAGLGKREVALALADHVLARGDAELYPRFTPTCEWDTAAGQAVLEAAGGAVVTLDGERLRYGKGTLGFLNPYFVAAANQALARQAAAEMARILA